MADAEGKIQEAASMVLRRRAARPVEEGNGQASRAQGEGVQTAPDSRQKARDTAQKALGNRNWKEQGAKRCFGPLHPVEGTLLPCLPNDPDESGFWFFKPGTVRAGKPFPRCKDCERARRGRDPDESGWVPAEYFEECAVWLAKQIGKAEACRRLGVSQNFYIRIERNEHLYMRKANANRIMEQIELVKWHNERRHWKDIRHGTSARAKKERRRRFRSMPPLPEQGPYLARVYPVKPSEPDKTWWVFDGYDWVPRYGFEVLGAEF